MTTHSTKTVDGKRYRVTPTPDPSMADPAYRWEASDGTTIEMTEAEENAYMEATNPTRSITD